MLPTGSGKTMVAAMLVRHMADELIRTKRKVRACLFSTARAHCPQLRSPTPTGLRKLHAARGSLLTC
jgi:hypothetical protein